MHKEQQRLRKTTEQMDENPKHSEGIPQTDNVEGGGNVDDMELGEFDLEGIENACDNLKDGYIPLRQLVLFKEALIKSKGTRGLGVVSDPMKGGEGKRRGRRTNAQRIQDVGGRLMASGEYPTINEVFDPPSKRTQ